jgi:hypothetical protein
LSQKPCPRLQREQVIQPDNPALPGCCLAATLEKCFAFPKAASAVSGQFGQLSITNLKQIMNIK